MIKRVFWVALYTGISQVLSLFTISYLIRHFGKEFGGYIGLIDSTVLVMAVIVSFGIQLSVNRNVAKTFSWRSNYVLAQSARFSVGLLIVVFGIVSYFFNWDITKWIFLVAPFIALNGDYILYGAGKPIKAARLSMIRVALPNLAILIGSRFIGEQALYLYMIFIGVGIINSGLWASKINQVPYLYPPVKNFHKFYFKYSKVGIYQLSSVVLLTGILTVAKGFYTVAMIGLVYGILKYFEVLKGVLRIIVQAFFRELREKGNNLRIDKAGILVGSGALIPALLFPDTTLKLLYKNIYDGSELLLPLFGIAMFLASFRTSSNIQVLLNRKDDVNLYSYVGALIITLITMIIFSYSPYETYGIPVAIILGELVLLIGLGAHLGGFQFFKERIVFFVKVLPSLGICFLLKIVLGNSITTLALSLAIYFLWTFFFYRKMLLDSSFLIKK